MRILTAAEMREADRRTIDDAGVPAARLMEAAGRAVVTASLGAFDLRSGSRVSVFCGKGNNGGDGLVAAVAFAESGATPLVCLTTRAESLGGDARAKYDRLAPSGIEVLEVLDLGAWERVRARLLDEADVIVDALVGLGLTGPLTGLLEAIVLDINRSGRPVVAVDIPSGLSADRASPIGPAVRAALTVTFAAPKLPLVSPPGDALAGALVVADIGIPPAVIHALPGARVEWTTADAVRGLVLPRKAASHKGTFGRVTIVGGSVGRTGAAVLAGRAALRSGAGLVTVATPASCWPVVAAQGAEYMTLRLTETSAGTVTEDALGPVLDLRADVIAAGPGLGQHASTSKFIHALLDRAQAPLVLDADALNALAGDLGRLEARRGRVTVITPHPAEMARLTGRSIEEVEAERLSLSREIATRYGIGVVLKGHRTVVAWPDGRAAINSSGNPGMATAGTGDVLTGVIAAWLAALESPGRATELAVWLHGRAGDLARDDHGEVAMVAGDLIDRLGDAVREVSGPSPSSPRKGRGA